MRGLSGGVDQSGPNANNSNWNTSKVFGPKVGSVVEHDNIIHQPTGNLVEMYGMAVSAERQPYVHCELFTGGNMRSVATGSQTGYFIQKLVPHTCNVVDKAYEWDGQLHTNLSYMRLADILLMFSVE